MLRLKKTSWSAAGWAVLILYPLLVFVVYHSSLIWLHTNEPQTRNELKRDPNYESARRRLVREDDDATHTATREVQADLSSSISHDAKSTQTLSSSIRRFGSERVFHVTQSGTVVEGGLLVSMIKQRAANSKKRVRFFNPIYWKVVKKGRTYEFTEGGCYWCPARESNDVKCTNKGRFFLNSFKDDHFLYSLKKRGQLDLIRMRPDNNPRASGKAQIDTLYAYCGDLQDIPFGVPGVLRVDHMDDFVQFVNPRVEKPSGKGGETAVCTKAFYGGEINSRTIYQFVKHYIENWGFDKVYVYEVGTSVGMLLLDIVLDSPLLTRYLNEGRLIYVDLRDEFQRMYGPIYGDVVMYSSKNAQLLVQSDCFNRAKLDNIEWILPIDWDEIITFGKQFSAMPHPRPTIAKWISSFNRQNRVGARDLAVLYLNRLAAPENSICEDCERDWDEAAILKRHVQTERTVNDTSTPIIKYDDTDSTPESSDDAGEFQATQEIALKYLVRTIRGKYPYSYGYGVHILSRYAFSENKFQRRVTTVPVDQIYLRHYKCMNSRSVCDKTIRYKLNWAKDFADIPSLNPPPIASDAATDPIGTTATGINVLSTEEAAAIEGSYDVAEERNQENTEEDLAKVA